MPDTAYDRNACYRMEPEKVLAALGTSRDGLSAAEAEARLEKHGKNELKAKIRIPLWLVFLSQFKELLILVLILGGGGFLFHRECARRLDHLHHRGGQRGDRVRP